MRSNRGTADSPGVPHLLAQSDLLLLPYNFDARSARYIRLSLPTKAPAYMISGTPVLVYAPADVATARYATREEWAYVVSEQGQQAVAQGLGHLMDTPPFVSGWGDEPRRWQWHGMMPNACAASFGRVWFRPLDRIRHRSMAIEGTS